LVLTSSIFVSIQVLDGLLEEDDEVVETWYLLGWVNSLRASFESKTDNGKQVRGIHIAKNV
jgi:hypothetical protein